MYILLCTTHFPAPSHGKSLKKFIFKHSYSHSMSIKLIRWAVWTWMSMHYIIDHMLLTLINKLIKKNSHKHNNNNNKRLCAELDHFCDRKVINIPLAWTMAISLVTWLYRMTRLHLLMSSPSSATEVATITLWSPLRKYSITSTCWFFVIPNQKGTEYVFTSLLLVHIS